MEGWGGVGRVGKGEKGREEVSSEELAMMVKSSFSYLKPRS